MRPPVAPKLQNKPIKSEDSREAYGSPIREIPCFYTGKPGRTKSETARNRVRTTESKGLSQSGSMKYENERMQPCAIC